VAFGRQEAREIVVEVVGAYVNRPVSAIRAAPLRTKAPPERGEDRGSLRTAGAPDLDAAAPHGEISRLLGEERRGVEIRGEPRAIRH